MITAAPLDPYLGGISTKKCSFLSAFSHPIRQVSIVCRQEFLGVRVLPGVVQGVSKLDFPGRSQDKFTVVVITDNIVAVVPFGQENVTLDQTLFIESAGII